MSRDKTCSEVPLLPAIEASGSGLSHAQDPRQPHFTSRFPIPIPAPAPMKARTPNENKSETAPPLLESVSVAPRSSGAGTAEIRAHTRSAMSICWNLQFWLLLIFIIRQAQRFYTLSNRPQSVGPSPERRSRSRGVTSELSTGESSWRAASSGRQKSPTSRSAEVPDHKSLQTISTDTSGQNSRSGCAPDTNQSNDDRRSIGHSNSPGIQTREELGRHLEELKDSTLTQKASAQENREKVPNRKKEELQEGHPSSLEEKTPEDTTSSAKSVVKDENSGDDCPTSSITHNKELDYRPVEKSLLDIFNGLFVGFDPLARFNERENCCIANTKEGNRCTRLIKHIDVSEIQRLLTRLSAPYATERLNSELLPLINLVLCGRSHRKDVRKLAENLSRGASVDNDITVTATAARTVEKQNKWRPKKSRACPTEATLQTPRYNLRGNHKYQTKLPQFTRWQPADSRNLSVLALVAKTMRKPLTRTEEKPGWLYVYWNQSNFGYRKIGYTTVGVAMRLRKWETQCRHRAEQITQSSQREGLQEMKEEEKVPHVRRLEALVHATLKEDRYCEPCCAACHSCHREWFNVKDPHKIQSVIAFWSEWIRREPYEFVEGEGKWMLKAQFEKEVEAMYQRLEKLENERQQQSQAATRPGPRRNERRGSERRNPNRRNPHLPETRRLRRLQWITAEPFTLPFKGLREEDNFIFWLR
ncbi:hypothetical protein MMC21_002028 [Puttea exsequens]|nr:hypothetical protein [Puttea exsequens]